MLELFSSCTQIPVNVIDFIVHTLTARWQYETTGPNKIRNYFQPVGSMNNCWVYIMPAPAGGSIIPLRPTDCTVRALQQFWLTPTQALVSDCLLRGLAGRNAPQLK